GGIPTVITPARAMSAGTGAAFAAAVGAEDGVAGVAGALAQIATTIESPPPRTMTADRMPFPCRTRDERGPTALPVAAATLLRAPSDFGTAVPTVAPIAPASSSARPCSHRDGRRRGVALPEPRGQSARRCARVGVRSLGTRDRARP